MSNSEQNVLDFLLEQEDSAFAEWYRGNPFPWMDNMAEEMTYFSPFANSLFDGKEAIVASIEPFAGQIHSPGFEVKEPKIQLGEDMAVLTFGLNELDEEGGLTVGWKVTEVYRKEENKWRMIHAHFSAGAKDE